MYQGQLLELYLNEIKRLHLNGLSAADIFAEIKQGSIPSVKKAIQSMRDGSAPVKITKVEEATRIAPSRVGKAQSADRAYTELKNKYSQELLDKTDEFTKNSKYKTLNQVENALFKYFNKSEYTKVPAGVPNKDVTAFFRPADKMFNIPQTFEIYGGEFGKRKGREKTTALRQIIGTKFLENNNSNYNAIKKAMTLFYTIPETKREDLDEGIKNKIRKFNKDFSITRAATSGSQSGIVNRFFEDFDFSKQIKEYRKIWTTKEGLQELINNPKTSKTDVAMYKKELNALTKTSDNVLNRLKTVAPELFKVGAPAGTMQLEHRVARALGQTGDLKLPKNYIARASYVPGFFNKAKFDTYDKPLMDLISEYNSGDKSAKSKILSLTKNFNNRTKVKGKGFLDNVNFEFGKKVKMVDSTPKFSQLNQLDVVKDVDKGVRSGKAFFESFGSEKVGTLVGKASDYVTPSKDIKTLSKILSNAAKTNQGGVCGIFRAKGGRIGYATGSSCSLEMEKALKNDPEKLAKDINKLPEQSGILNKIKNAGTRFLQGIKNPGSFKTKVAIGAGAVVAGGGAAALVSQFRNDDKSTYLTSDRQMEGMVIADDIEKDLDDMGFILDNEGKIELAATGALSASMVKKVYNAARAGEAQLLELPQGLEDEAKKLNKTINEIIKPPLSKKQLARKAFLKKGLKTYLDIQKNYPKQYDALQRRIMDDKIKGIQAELKILVPRKAKRITETGQQVLREARDRLNQIEQIKADTKLRGQELKTYVDSSTGKKVQKLVSTGELVNPGKSGRIMSALGLRKGVLGLGLNAFMAPAVALPTSAFSLARDIKSGKSVEDTVTNPFTYLPAAFMRSGLKGLGKMGASRGLMSIAGLGLGSVAAAPVVGAISTAAGLATLGSLGYQGYKKFRDRNKTDQDFFN